MKTTQLANGFATRIEDIDLSKPLDDDSFETIRDLWMENRIVVFPEQQLDDDQLVAFTQRFGPLFVHAQASLLTTYKRCLGGCELLHSFKVISKPVLQTLGT